MVQPSTVFSERGSGSAFSDLFICLFLSQVIEVRTFDSSMEVVDCSRVFDSLFSPITVRLLLQRRVRLNALGQLSCKHFDGVVSALKRVHDVGEV